MDGDAYSMGQVIGILARWGILIAGTVVTVQRLRSGQYSQGRAAATFAVLGALMIFSVTRDFGGDSLEKQRAAMMSSCTSSGQAESYCGCIWDSLQAAGLDTPEELDAMQARAGQGVMPPEVASAALACS